MTSSTPLDRLMARPPEVVLEDYRVESKRRYVSVDDVEFEIDWTDPEWADIEKHIHSGGPVWATTGFGGWRTPAYVVTASDLAALKRHWGPEDEGLGWGLDASRLTSHQGQSVFVLTVAC